jgi:EF-P beta-lysylation protein EpmB
MKKAAWQTSLANAITDPAELLTLLELDSALLPAAQTASQLFQLRVPRGFVARMQKGDVNDPLLKQILPLDSESISVEGFTTDPVGDVASNKIPGLLHKYHGRVLIMPTSACAINCRYCFRRSFAYDDNNPGTVGWEKVFAYIAADATIEEVILSGGDPLVANDKTLAYLIEHVAQIPHVQRLRIHTRLPIVLPERITDELIELLTNTRLQPVLMIHANHPNEIDEHVATALQKLRTGNIMLYNQAVLLKGINDDVVTLATLQKKLFSLRVQPYYLNLLDRVQGAAHFEVDEATARKLHTELAATLSGYLVPQLVREEAGAPFKSKLTQRS